MRRSTTVAVLAMMTLAGAITASAFAGFGDGSESEDIEALAAGLDAGRQADAKRLTALAEHHSLASMRKARAAETARWQAIGEMYRRDRACQSQIDRLNGMAEQFGLAGLPRGQETEADRLTRSAEYQRVALCGRVWQLGGPVLRSHGRP